MSFPLHFLILPDPSSPISIGWVLAVIFALATGALVLKQLFTRTPALNEEFVTRREFRALENRLDKKMEELSEQLEENSKAGEQRVIKLHDRLNALPMEIINVLRKTKGLL